MRQKVHSRRVTNQRGDFAEANGYLFAEASSNEPSCMASGAISAPLGQTTVPISGSTDTWEKNATSRSGSKIGPTELANFGPRSIVRKVPSTKPTRSRYSPRWETLLIW